MAHRPHRLIAAAVTMIAAVMLLSGTEAQTDAPLFSSHEPVLLTLESDVRTLVNRRARRPEVDGFVRYAAEDGTEVQLDVEVRTRGKSRLEVCAFPPLSVNFKRGQVADTLFASQNRLKLVTLCRPTTTHEEYLELEYLAYRIYETVSEHAFRVRPVLMRYVDTERDGRVTEAPGFFIEHIEGVAERTGRVEAELPSVAPEELEPAPLATLTLFQFLVGNTDWSALAAAEDEDCCHNADVLGRADGSPGLIVVPYDFDQTGLVNPSYAEPDERLGIRSVRQRVYRGLCAINDELDVAIAKFNAARPRIEALLADTRLADERRQEALEYLSSAYEIFNDSEQREKEIVGRCRG